MFKTKQNVLCGLYRDITIYYSEAQRVSKRVLEVSTYNRAEIDKLFIVRVSPGKSSDPAKREADVAAQNSR